MDKTGRRPDLPPLSDEMPLLLNPEIDTPESHLGFDKNGRIIGKTERGKATIELCKLQRDPLIAERKKLIDGFIKDIKIVLVGFLKGEGMPMKTFKAQLESIFTEMEGRQAAHHAYALLARFIFTEFDEFLASRFGQPFRNALSEIFSDYRSRKR